MFGLSLPLAFVTALVLLGGLIAALSAWPATTIVVSLAAAGLWLAVKAPAVGLILVIAGFGFEGTAKALLVQEPFPLSIDSRAVVAGALDLMLALAILRLGWRNRGGVLDQVWRHSSRLERFALAGICGWLVLSVFQIPIGASLVDSIEGLRLTHFYVLAAAAGAIAFWPRGDIREARVKLLLAVLLVTALYAALRVAIGPAEAELSYARMQVTGVEFEATFRTVGGSSSAVALGSVLAPLAVFSTALGIFDRSLRRVALLTAIAALGGIVGSYGRAPLVAILLGLLLVLVAALASSRSKRLKRTAVVVCAGVLTIGAVATVLAASISPVLQERALGLIQPADDESLQLRLETWRAAAETALREPLGLGLGTVGRATAEGAKATVTTDNSILKVAVEQGPAMAGLLLLSLLGLIIATFRRLLKRSADDLALGVAALAAVVTFVGLLPAAEYIEQPGKVLAWTLLGAALACAWRPTPGSSALGIAEPGVGAPRLTSVASR